MSYIRQPSDLQWEFEAIGLDDPQPNSMGSSSQSGDDIYEFSSSGGKFIIDGAGIDTINAEW